MISCPICQQLATKRDCYDEQDRQRYGCRPCHRDFTARSMLAFFGSRWPADVILTAVHWYASSPLSANHVRQLLAERYSDVSARIVLNWVQTFGPPLAMALHSHRRWLGRQWYMDKVFCFRGKQSWGITSMFRTAIRTSCGGDSIREGRHCMSQNGGAEGPLVPIYYGCLNFRGEF
jgi:transposase-like protein